MDWYSGKSGAAPGAEKAVTPAVLTNEALRSQKDPAGYEASPEVTRAVNVALALRMPLLVGGEPGSGKTQLGYAVAHELGKGKPLKFVTKSTSQARDLFYGYDAVRHFRAAQSSGAGGGIDAREFIDYEALGLAILLASPLEERKRFLAPSIAGAADADPNDERARVRNLLASDAPRQSVVIIDEIDKAPRDFPNDLLDEIDNMTFRVPELPGLEARAPDSSLRPIIIITTNAERSLPDAFLRRCAFIHIPYPRGKVLNDILKRRLSSLYGGSTDLLKDAAAFYESIREKQLLDKPPGAAELIQFLQAAIESGADPKKSIQDQRKIIEDCVMLLGKSDDDQKKIAKEISQWRKAE